MKKNYKKIISLVLTVLMLVGTVSAMIPLTVSAAGTEIERNTNHVVNGITYRFDPLSSNTNSSAVVNSDNTITLTMKQGDLFWIPSVTIGSDSVLNMKVTLDSSNGGQNKSQIACGLAYNIDAGEDGVWSESTDSLHILNARTNYRVRIAKGTINTMKSGSVTDVKTGTFTSSDVVNRLFSSGKKWIHGKTLEMNLQLSDTKTVAASFCNDQSAEFASLSYTGVDTFTGPVGFGVNWSGDSTENGYMQVTINSFDIKNAIIGNEKVNYSLFEAPKQIVNTDLTPNSDNWINGQNYRFETSKTDGSSYAKIENGKLVLKLNAGDLFWIPTLTIKDTTSAYSFKNVTTDTNGTRIMVVNNIKTGQNMYSTGIAHNGESVWVVNRQKWNSYGIAIASYDKNYTEITDWGGTERPVDGNWQTSETLNIRTTFETWTKIVPRVYFKEGSSTEYNMRNYYSLDYGAEGTSFGISIVTGSATVTIDKITATNMNEVASYDETFFTVDTTSPASITDEQISLTLDGTIGLNFAFNAANLADATVVATKNGETIATKDVVDGENVITAPVNAKEMNDTVNFAIMVGGEEYKSYTASVKEYADNLMADDNYNKWDALMTAMLKYGAAAQKLLGYKAENVDVSGIDYDFSEYTAIEFTGEKNILAGLYMNLSLESDTVMKLYFMPADGVKPSVEINSGAVELVDNGDGYYVASIEGIAADKLAEDVEIKVNGDLTFKVNALDWANIASNDGDENVATLAKALATYADAAVEIKTD